MSHEQESNNEYGFYIHNIIHFPRQDYNTEVKYALYGLINATCEDLGTYGLVISSERPYAKTTTAFLRFDDDNFNPIAVERINGQPLKIDNSTYRLQLVAKINPLKPSQVAEEFHQRHRFIRLAASRNAYAEPQPTANSTIDTEASSSRQSTFTTTTSHHTRSTSVRRLQRAVQDPRDKERCRASSQAAMDPPYVAPPPTTDHPKSPQPLFSLQDPSIASIRRARVDHVLLLDEAILCFDCSSPTTVSQLPVHRSTCAAYIQRITTKK